MKKSRGSMDRRAARTRRALHHAMVDLMLERDYEAITTEDICKAAKVGRSTFYDHYTSKDDLHRSGVENLRQALVDRRAASVADPGDVEERCLWFSLPLFEHVYEYKALLGALAGGRGGAIALVTIRRILSELVRDELARSSSPDWLHATPRGLVVQYIVGAYISVLAWWLDGGATLPPRTIDSMFRRMIIEGIMPSGPTIGVSPR